MTLLVINTDRDRSRSLTLPNASERYTLDAADLRDVTMRLNGRVLALEANDELPPIAGAGTALGLVTFTPPRSPFQPCRQQDTARVDEDDGRPRPCSRVRVG